METRAAPSAASEAWSLIAQLFTSLGRANFRVDTLLEPEPSTSGRRSGSWHDHMRFVPATLVLRARKQGL